MSSRPGEHRTADVLVVGAGPTGLLVAGDLARRGHAVRVLERRTEESLLTRAFAVHARTLEELDMRGLADRLVDTGQRVSSLRLFGSLSLDLSTLPSRFPFVLVTPQYHVERLLEERALQHGAVVERGVEVTGVTQAADGVIVHGRGPDGGTTYRAAYVVGADGHHSTVREQVGLDFPGRAVVRSLMLADVRLRQPPPDVLTVEGGNAGFCFVVPYGDGWYRVIAWDRDRQLPDDEAVDLGEILAVFRSVLGTDLGMHSPRWLSRFHSEERQVRRYQVGRVLLAGDAAHVHSPAGGMGMNTGLQDAANLGWRLAAALHGADQLLDGYDAERRPVGRMVLRMSGGLLRAAMLGPPPARFLRNTAARVAVSVPPVRDRVRGRVSGIGITYDAPAGAHELVGTRAEDLVGADGRRLHEVLRDGRFVLVLPPGAAVAAGTDHVELHRVEGVTGCRLVRPDGYVAWATDADAGELGGALHAWGLGPQQPTRQP